MKLPQLDYPNINTLPKPVLGWRLCKLVQYEDVDTWTFTSSFGTIVKFQGKGVSFNTWVPGQNNSNKTKPQFQECGWLNESLGWTDEELLKLVEDGTGYLYFHESGEKDPLTVQEYREYLESLDDQSIAEQARPSLQVQHQHTTTEVTVVEHNGD